MRKIVSVLLLLFLLCGCGKPLVKKSNRVSIYLVETPTITPKGFSIKLRFISPEPYSHLIQGITFNGTPYTGTEAFKVFGYFCEVDHHFGTRPTDRTMLIMPGEVAGVDESEYGFSMLPDNWPPNFNQEYQTEHNIQGRITRRFPQGSTLYHIRYDGNKIEFISNGEYYVWYAKDL